MCRNHIHQLALKDFKDTEINWTRAFTRINHRAISGVTNVCEADVTMLAFLLQLVIKRMNFPVTKGKCPFKFDKVLRKKALDCILQF